MQEVTGPCYQHISGYAARSSALLTLDEKQPGLRGCFRDQFSLAFVMIEVLLGRNHIICQNMRRRKKVNFGFEIV